MSMFLVNTVCNSNAGTSYHDKWFSRGVVVASGPEKYKKRLDRPEPGDLVLMYVNSIGIVGMGEVLLTDAEWTRDTVSPYEPHEYHRKVEWQRDFRDDPVPPSTVERLFGQTPLQTVQRVSMGEAAFTEYVSNLSSH